MRKNLYVKPVQPTESLAKPNIHNLLYSWQDQKGPIYCERYEWHRAALSNTIKAFESSIGRKRAKYQIGQYDSAGRLKNYLEIQ